MSLYSGVVSRGIQRFRGGGCRLQSNDAIRQGIVGMVGSIKNPRADQYLKLIPPVCRPCLLSRNDKQKVLSSDHHSSMSELRRQIRNVPETLIIVIDTWHLSWRAIPYREFHIQNPVCFPDDYKIRPVLDSMVRCTPAPYFSETVPGKGPPPEIPMEECCMSGCALCVWGLYSEDLKDYFDETEGQDRVKKAIKRLENPELRRYLMMELELS